MVCILFVGKVQLFELVKGLGKKAQHSSLKKQINRVEKREKVLDVPLPRHQLEQVSIIVLLYSLCMKWTSENKVIMLSAVLSALTCDTIHGSRWKAREATVMIITRVV